MILKIIFLSYLDKDGRVQPVPFKQEPAPDEKADTIVAAVNSIIKPGESFLKLVAAACCATFKSFTHQLANQLWFITISTVSYHESVFLTSIPKPDLSWVL